ncbi:MAG TPA: MFS transporter [Streptosporangiaceae bacterium]|jgi:MFS family permease
MPGTLLNALNSSMIAVALVGIERDFHSGVATATWLISAFYIAAAVGQPLMGKLADRFGPRRVFVSGLVVVLAVSAVAPFAPGLGYLIAARVVLAVGTSVAFPSAMAIFRACLPGPTPQSALGSVAAANSASAAFGPVIGGFLVSFWGWQAIFLVNVPITAIGIVLALTRLPKVAGDGGSGHGVLREMDVPGIGAFVLTLIGLLGFLLSLEQGPNWLLVPLAVVGGVALALRELRATTPFIDFRMLAANRALLSVYGQFALVNIVFYASFFGVPMWLEEARGDDTRTAGLLVLPLAGVAVLAMPLASRLIRRAGVRTSLLVGSSALLVGSLGLQLFGRGTPVWLIVIVTALLGVPNAFNNLGLQTALYQTAPRAVMGTASGLFQTSRYLGSILSASVIGLLFGASVDTSGLHAISWVMVTMSVVLVAVSLGRLRRGGQIR